MAVINFNKPIGGALNEINTLEEWRQFFEAFFEQIDAQFPTEFGAPNRSVRILDGTDLDALYHGGDYYCVGCSNTPNGEDGFLQSMVATTSTPGEFIAMQRYTDISTGATATRTFPLGGPWSAWA